MKNWKPMPVDGARKSYSASVHHLMPKYSEIPDEFRTSRTPWNALFSQWFFHGLREVPKVKAGFNRGAALQHISAVMRSYEPKHEHKEAAVAYLMSLWLELPEGTK